MPSTRPGGRQRRRYVAFIVDARQAEPPARDAFVAALDAACTAEGLSAGRRLTLYDGRSGVARCSHTEQAALLRALCSIARAGGTDVAVSTVATSGTIKKAKDHLRHARGL